MSTTLQLALAFLVIGALLKFSVGRSVSPSALIESLVELPCDIIYACVALIIGAAILLPAAPDRQQALVVFLSLLGLVIVSLILMRVSRDVLDSSRKHKMWIVIGLFCINAVAASYAISTATEYVAPSQSSAPAGGAP